MRSRTQPSGCGSAENHTTAGTTSDDGHSGPTRSICSTPFCSAHTTVRSSHSRASHPDALWFWVSFTASRTTSTATADVGRIGEYRPWHDDRIQVVGPDLDAVARSVAAQQDLVARGMQQRRHGRADGPGTDDRDAVYPQGQATGATATSRLWQSSRQAFPRELSVLRSHAAGSLRATDAGQTVTLAGWVARRRDHGGVIFIDLRDASGVSQVVFREAGVLEAAHRLRAEFCVAVEGVVEIRPEGNANPDIATGDIEVNATIADGAGGERAAAVPARRDRGRGGAPEVPLSRSAARGSRHRDSVAVQGQCRRTRRVGRATTSSRSRRRR